MNFLSICQMVFDEGDRAPYHITTVKYKVDEDEQIYKVVNFVKQAYREIQLWSRFFRFHQAFEQVLITTSETSGEDYTKSNVRKIDRNSLRARRVGETADWDLTYLSYEQWQHSLRSSTLAAGVPVWLVELPDGKFRLQPEPDGAYEILADWTRSLDKMEDNRDEPIWDEDLHEIIVWVALQYYMTEFEVPEELATRTGRALSNAKNEFLLRYLPDLED